MKGKKLNQSGGCNEKTNEVVSKVKARLVARSFEDMEKNIVRKDSLIRCRDPTFGPVLFNCYLAAPQ